MATESREERRLIRQRGAGARELRTATFGFNFGGVVSITRTTPPFVASILLPDRATLPGKEKSPRKERSPGKKPLLQNAVQSGGENDVPETALTRVNDGIAEVALLRVDDGVVEIAPNRVQDAVAQVQIIEDVKDVVGEDPVEALTVTKVVRRKRQPREVALVTTRTTRAGRKPTVLQTTLSITADHPVEFVESLLQQVGQNKKQLKKRGRPPKERINAGLEIASVQSKETRVDQGHPANVALTTHLMKFMLVSQDGPSYADEKPVDNSGTNTKKSEFVSLSNHEQGFLADIGPVNGAADTLRDGEGMKERGRKLRPKIDIETIPNSSKEQSDGMNLNDILDDHSTEPAHAISIQDKLLTKMPGTSTAIVLPKRVQNRSMNPISASSNPSSKFDANDQVTRSKRGRPKQADSRLVSEVDISNDEPEQDGPAQLSLSHDTIESALKSGVAKDSGNQKESCNDNYAWHSRNTRAQRQLDHKVRIEQAFTLVASSNVLKKEQLFCQPGFDDKFNSVEDVVVSRRRGRLRLAGSISVNSEKGLKSKRRRVAPMLSETVIENTPDCGIGVTPLNMVSGHVKQQSLVSLGSENHRHEGLLPVPEDQSLSIVYTVNKLHEVEDKPKPTQARKRGRPPKIRSLISTTATATTTVVNEIMEIQNPGRIQGQALPKKTRLRKVAGSSTVTAAQMATEDAAKLERCDAAVIASDNLVSNDVSPGLKGLSQSPTCFISKHVVKSMKPQGCKEKKINEYVDSGGITLITSNEVSQSAMNINQHSNGPSEPIAHKETDTEGQLGRRVTRKRKAVTPLLPKISQAFTVSESRNEKNIGSTSSEARNIITDSLLPSLPQPLQQRSANIPSLTRETKISNAPQECQVQKSSRPFPIFMPKKNSRLAVSRIEGANNWQKEDWFEPNVPKALLKR